MLNEMRARTQIRIIAITHNVVTLARTGRRQAEAMAAQYIMARMGLVGRPAPHKRPRA